MGTGREGQNPAEQQGKGDGLYAKHCAGVSQTLSIFIPTVQMLLRKAEVTSLVTQLDYTVKLQTHVNTFNHHHTNQDTEIHSELFQKMIWSLRGGGEFTSRDRHLGVFKVDQQVAEGTGEAETIWQENKHGSWKNTRS